MRVLEGQQTLLRIFIGETDKFQGRPLHQALIDLFRAEKLAGATAIKGIAGFGAKSHLHTAGLVALSQNLPIIVETVDTPEKINALLPAIDNMITDGLVTMEKINVIRYAPKE